MLFEVFRSTTCSPIWVRVIGYSLMALLVRTWFSQTRQAVKHSDEERGWTSNCLEWLHTNIPLNIYYWYNNSIYCYNSIGIGCKATNIFFPIPLNWTIEQFCFSQVVVRLKSVCGSGPPWFLQSPSSPPDFWTHFTRCFLPQSIVLTPPLIPSHKGQENRPPARVLHPL